MFAKVRSLSHRASRLLSPQFLAKGQRGMSLIEIIIVVALLGTLMAYMVSNLIGQSENAKKDQVKLLFGVLQQNLQLYKIHNNKYPPDLKALITNPGDVKTWRGPYTEENKLKDPWNNDIGYESDGRDFKLHSAGPDGQMGNDDDINFPETDAKPAS